MGTDDHASAVLFSDVSRTSDQQKKATVDDDNLPDRLFEYAAQDR